MRPDEVKTTADARTIVAQHGESGDAVYPLRLFTYTLLEGPEDIADGSSAPLSELRSLRLNPGASLGGRFWLLYLTMVDSWQSRYHTQRISFSLSVPHIHQIMPPIVSTVVHSV